MAKTKKSFLFLFIGISLLWIFLSFLSKGNFIEISSLIFLQIILTFVLVFFAFKDYSYKSALIQIISIHFLIYYGLFNIIPALIPEWRPDNISIMLSRIPKSDIFYYSIATFSSILFFLGCISGVYTYNYFFNRNLKDIKYANNWFLPNSKLSLYIGFFLIFIQLLSLFLFALNSDLVSDDDLLNLNFFEQIIFHGVTYFSTVSILLFVSAHINSTNLKTKKHIKLAIIFSIIISLFVVVILGQRSTVLISFLLPVLYLLTNGKIKFSKIIFPFLVIAFTLYTVVSFFRDSNVKMLLTILKNNEINFTEITKDVSSSKDNFDLITRSIGDISYRTAGLEPCAAIIESQYNNQLNYKWGTTIYSGILQALPRFFRNTDYVPERIKTAPYQYGIFGEGDWVTTILSEFVLDFGPFLIFIPAIFLGLVLALIDHIFLFMINFKLLKSISIIRLSFLIFLLSNGGSFAEITFLFFKAVFGFTMIFILLTYLSNINFKLLKKTI